VTGWDRSVLDVSEGRQEARAAEDEAWDGGDSRR
jgi:hypothetical protein